MYASEIWQIPQGTQARWPRASTNWSPTATAIPSCAGSGWRLGVSRWHERRRQGAGLVRRRQLARAGGMAAAAKARIDVGQLHVEHRQQLPTNIGAACLYLQHLFARRFRIVRVKARKECALLPLLPTSRARGAAGARRTRPMSDQPTVIPCAPVLAHRGQSPLPPNVAAFEIGELLCVLRRVGSQLQYMPVWAGRRRATVQPASPAAERQIAAWLTAGPALRAALRSQVSTGVPPLDRRACDLSKRG